MSVNSQLKKKKEACSTVCALKPVIKEDGLCSPDRAMRVPKNLSLEPLL